MQTFNRKHAKEILKPCGLGHYITIDKRGVWPKVKYDKAMKAETVLLSWRPARVFKGEPGAPKVGDTPMLPFPFSAHELAAFMLNGAGEGVLDFYGYWSDGPDPERIDEIDPDSESGTALIQAYAAYHDAKKSVGAYPLALEAEAKRAREAYNLANNEANIREGVYAAMPGTEESAVRRARAVASIAALDDVMEATATAAKTESEVWLKAMVRQLLQPASAQTPATPAPVEPTSDGMGKRRVKKPTVEAVALDYMREVYKAGQFQSAAKFHKHLTQTAGATGSPFEMGTGDNARKLFCPAASSFYDPATLGKIWAKIRAV